MFLSAVHYVIYWYVSIVHKQQGGGFFSVLKLEHLYWV